MTQPNIIVYGTADVGRVPALDENNVFSGTNTFNTLNGTTGTIDDLVVNNTLSGSAINYVPYSGGTGDVNLGVYNISAAAFKMPDSGEFVWDEGGANQTLLNIDGANLLHISDGAIGGIFDFTGITTSDKTYTFPDASGTIALVGISSTVSFQDLGTITHTMIFTDGVLTSYATS